MVVEGGALFYDLARLLSPPLQRRAADLLAIVPAGVADLPAFRRPLPGPLLVGAAVGLRQHPRAGGAGARLDRARGLAAPGRPAAAGGPPQPLAADAAAREPRHRPPLRRDLLGHRGAGDHGAEEPGDHRAGGRHPPPARPVGLRPRHLHRARPGSRPDPAPGWRSPTTTSGSTTTAARNTKPRSPTSSGRPKPTRRWPRPTSTWASPTPSSTTSTTATPPWARPKTSRTPRSRCGTTAPRGSTRPKRWCRPTAARRAAKKCRGLLADLWSGRDRKASISELWRRNSGLIAGVFALLLAIAVGQLRQTARLPLDRARHHPAAGRQPIARTLIPGLDSANDDNGIGAFLAILPVVALLHPDLPLPGRLPLADRLRSELHPGHDRRGSSRSSS